MNQFSVMLLLWTAGCQQDTAALAEAVGQDRVQPGQESEAEGQGWQQEGWVASVCRRFSACARWKYCVSLRLHETLGCFVKSEAQKHESSSCPRNQRLLTSSLLLSSRCSKMFPTQNSACIWTKYPIYFKLLVSTVLTRLGEVYKSHSSMSQNNDCLIYWQICHQLTVS
jgi:hypothetical protein